MDAVTFFFISIILNQLDNQSSPTIDEIIFILFWA